MFTIPREMKEIKKNPISHQLASDLARTSMFIGMVKGQIIGTPYKKLLWDAMLISGICCLDATQRIPISAYKIVADICSDKNNFLKQQYNSLKSAYEFAAKQAERFGILSATDYLKIHYFLTNDTPLEELLIDVEPIAEELWNLFSTFYSAESDYPKLFEAGIILYCLENIVSVPLHPLCKELIVQYAINRNFKIDYTSILICRQLYRYNDSSKPIEDYLRSFLQVLFDAAIAKGRLFMCIQDTFNDLDSEMGCFQNNKLDKKMLKELLQNLSITNSFVEQT